MAPWVASTLAVALVAIASAATAEDAGGWGESAGIRLAGDPQCPVIAGTYAVEAETHLGNASEERRRIYTFFAPSAIDSLEVETLPAPVSQDQLTFSVAQPDAENLVISSVASDGKTVRRRTLRRADLQFKCTNGILVIAHSSRVSGEGVLGTSESQNLLSKTTNGWLVIQETITKTNHSFMMGGRIETQTGIYLFPPRDK